MCLSINKNTKIQRAKKSITVWKVLDYLGKAPFWNTSYRRGQLKTCAYFTQHYQFGKRLKKVTDTLAGTGAIERGLHVFTSFAAAERFWTGSLIVECTIPRHTKYIKGKNSQIATLGLRVGKAFPKTAWNQFLVDRFNSRRVKNGRKNRTL